MLDTDTISYVLKGGAPVIDARVRELPPHQVCISSVSRGELLYGVRLKDGAHRLAQLVDQFLTRVRSVPWGDEAADCFGTIAAQLTKAGTPIGSMDTMIAAHALATGAVLVTNNTKHFSRVSGLVTENWA
jgi:tRNA(fMet)-specific endonuclease VapC